MVGKKSPTKAVILGAGFAGLTVGFELAKSGIDVLVLEKENIPGGLAKTTRFDDYYLDSGPHLFHTSNRDISAYWEANFPGEFRFPALYGGNYVDGEIYDYPLNETSIGKLPKAVREAVAVERANLSEDVVASATDYRSYIEAIAGPTLQRYFYEEYPKKLWGIPTDYLSANWAPRRIEIRKDRRPFHGSHWCGVASLGCGRIADLLAQKIINLGGIIKFEEAVTGVRLEGSEIAKIETTSQTIEISDDTVVISTIAVNQLARLLGEDTSLTFRSIKLVSFVTEQHDPLPPDYDWLYFQDPSLCFHRVGSQTRFSTIGIERGLSILTAELAYSPGDSIDLLEENDLVRKCEADLARVGIPLESIKATHVQDLGPVYPGYRVGYEEELRRINVAAESVANLHQIGSLAEFAYSDVQILFAKGLDLAARITNAEFRFNHVNKSSRRNSDFQAAISVEGIGIGGEKPPFLIAEIGLNHNRDLEIARHLVDRAVEAGFSAVKLQTYQKGRASSKSQDANFKEDLLDSEESYDQMFDRLILEPDEIADIFNYADSRGIIPFSTPFDINSFLSLEELGCRLYKVSSMDLVNLDLIRAVAGSGKPVILSTGMSTISEIEDAVQVVEETGNTNLALLHCVSSYPTPASELNLRAIPKLRDYFGVPVGFSDHSSENFLIPAAVALGASLIEKHITLDKRLKGPDHFFSLEPSQMSELVQLSRSTFSALGNGRKRVMPSEVDALRKLRRSLFARQEIGTGVTITPDMLVVKSPGVGILPKYAELVCGRVARRTIYEDTPISWSDI